MGNTHSASLPYGAGKKVSTNTQTSNSHIAEHASPFRQFATLTDTFPEGKARRIAEHQH